MKYIYITLQFAISAIIGLVIVWCGRIILTEPTSLYSLEPYNIGGLNSETWKGQTKQTIWLSSNLALIDTPKAFDFTTHEKIPIRGNIKNGFYRDPFVNANGNIDYFTTGMTGKDDAKFLEWLTQVGQDLQKLQVIGVKEKESVVFLKTEGFTTWVSPTQPMSIPIPAEFWQIMLDKAPEQIRKGKLLLQMIRLENDAVWFKIPLMRTPLKVSRKQLDNTPIKNILQPL